MTTMILQVPDSLEKEHDETVRFIASKFYESGKLTLGQAAEMCNLSKPAFAEVLGDYEVSLLNYSVSEILRDESRI